MADQESQHAAFEEQALGITHEWMLYLGYTQAEIDAAEDAATHDLDLEPEDDRYHACNDLLDSGELVEFVLERSSFLAHTRRTENDRLSQALSFAASVIKSGEPWTDTCEEVIGGALRGAEGEA